MGSGMSDWHGHVLVKFLMVLWYRCLALSKGFKEKSKMTYGVMV